MNTVFIAVGSNLDHPPSQIKAGLEQLAEFSHIAALSNWYRSTPLGPTDQQDFLNGAVKIETPLDAFSLLTALQQIEHNQHRRRLIHWGPRTLDLDIALFNQSSIYHKRLTVPHAELLNRDFVLKPLADIDPDLTLPSGKTIQDALSQVPDNQLVKLNELDDYDSCGHNNY